MNAREIRYLFSPSELTRGHDRFFLLPRLIILVGIVGWLGATLKQIEFIPEQREQLVKGTLPILIAYTAYTAFFIALVKRFPERRRAIYQTIILMDVALISMLIYATGNCMSNFYLAYYLFIAVEVFYFGMFGGALVTCLSCVVYLGLYIVNSDQLFAGDFALRVGFMFLTFVVLASLEENEKASRLQIQMKRDQIESLNMLLEEKNKRLVEENEYKEKAGREKSELLQREQLSAQRRRMHIDFAKELNSKETVEEVCSLFSRYVGSLTKADNVTVLTLERSTRTAFMYRNLNGEEEKTDVPFSHPLIKEFFPDGSEAVAVKRTWIASEGDEMPDTFMIVPGEQPEALHVEIVTGGAAGTTCMIVMARRSGKKFSSHLLEEAGLISNHLAVSIKNLNLRARLQEMADTDGLTGLFNHRYFQKQIELEARRAKRYKRPLSLILFDIDHFKSFNDSYGHPIGDAVLKEISTLARESLRNVDILCRYGGEEFAALLPETDSSSALAIAERMRNNISSHVFQFANMEPLTVTVSLGIATMPPAADKQELISMADQALYRAKDGGRNRVAS